MDGFSDELIGAIYSVIFCLIAALGFFLYGVYRTYKARRYPALGHWRVYNYKTKEAFMGMRCSLCLGAIFGFVGWLLYY